MQLNLCLLNTVYMVTAGPAEQGRPGGPWPTQLQKIVLQPDGDLAELPVKGMR